MIIFDTNAVNLLPPNSPRADIIRKLRESRHHRVAVPWIVLEEMAAHQAVYYPERHKSAANVLQKLQDVLPWELQSSLEPLDLERLLDHWRDAYREIFEVIDTSGEAARRAFAREAMALPPAKRDKNRSEGGRDAAIWFSILEFLKENPEEHICFVTNNTGDFGDGTAYKYPMDEDVRGLEDRLTRLADFDQVVSHFTREVSGKDVETTACGLLRSLVVRSRLAQTVVEALTSPTGFVGMADTGAAVQWRSWMAPPEVELLDVTDVVGHEIEGDIWYTASARWLLYGFATEGDGMQSIACVWEVKVLFSTTDEPQTPTLLTPGEPSLPDMADKRCAEALQRLRTRAAAVPDYDFADLPDSAKPAASVPKLDIAGLIPSVSLAQQLAASMPTHDFGDLLGRANWAQQLAASMPKHDFGDLLGRANWAQQLLASMPEHDTSRLAYPAKAPEPSSDDETESNGDEETEER